MSSMLLIAFNNAVNLKKLDYDNEVNILMGGNGISNRITSGVVSKLKRHRLEKKDKEFIEDLFRLTLQQILENLRAVRQQLYDAINRINVLIDRTDEEINHIQESLQNITRRHGELNNAIEARHFEKGGTDAYKSRAIEETVKAYQIRTGEKLPEGITPEILIQTLRSQQGFEQKRIVPLLENRLIRLHAFRDNAQNYKETLEQENVRIDGALETIDADTSLTDGQRRNKKVEILKEASAAALGAQLAAHAAEAEFVRIITELQEEIRASNNYTYLKFSNNENAELNESALKELQNIKPILPQIP